MLRKSNISSNSFSGYLKKLIDEGFVRETINSNVKRHLSLTDKGLNYLEKYKTIIDFIDEFNL